MGLIPDIDRPQQRGNLLHPPLRRPGTLRSDPSHHRLVLRSPRQRRRSAPAHRFTFALAAVAAAGSVIIRTSSAMITDVSGSALANAFIRVIDSAVFAV